MAPPRLTLVSNQNPSEGQAVREVAPASPVVQSPPAASPADAAVPDDAAAKAVSALTSTDRNERLRILEALLFAAAEPLDEASLASRLPGGNTAAVADLLDELKSFYRGRGINLVRVAGKWSFRTAEDLSYLLERLATEERKLSKAALETLAIVAYHQPVTRAEIEEIRGVTTSAGTLDILMETGWIRPRGRRRAPGKPITYGTTEPFLSHFGLDSIRDLPGLAELKGAGLLDGNLPPGFSVPEPTDVAALLPDELPLEDEDAADDQSEMSLDLPADDETDTPASDRS
ncbi:MAG: SMC-Scp complex subunit ScpB [Hyphomicrobium sp.]